LWQEGHNAFATADEAEKDARRMLEVYHDFFENYLAIPGIAGAKTPDERFPGAIETYTIEAFMQDGKALQGCTSHNLGQTFAKSCDIQYLGKDGVKTLAWTTSWGMSTRTIGGLIMSHGDDDGMIMPPRLAPYQVAIIPFLQDDSDRAKILEFCDTLRGDLIAKGVSAQVDRSDARNADKVWSSIKRGVPMRVEIGAREIAEGQVTAVRRDLGKDGKKKMPTAEFLNTAVSMLEQMQSDLLTKAKARLKTQITDISSIKEMRDFFAADKAGGVRIDYSLVQNSAEFEALRKEFSITPRCLPFADGGKKLIVAKSY
jgi:prolyl-tRNA synthetase